MQRDGYYMQFDADDILHPDFCKHVLEDHNGRGYLVSQGHFVALATKQVIPLGDFGFYCGSCAAVYVDFRQNRSFVALLNQHRNHNEIAAYCELYERPLADIPFPAVLYITGHGENMYGREGHLEGRTRQLIKQALTDEDAIVVLTKYDVSWDILTE